MSTGGGECLHENTHLLASCWRCHKFPKLDWQEDSLPLRHLGSPCSICTHTQILGMEIRKRKIGVEKEVLCPGKQRVEKLKKIIFTAVGLQTDEHILLGSKE